MNPTLIDDREEDGRWIVEVPELPGVMTYGVTRDEASKRAEVLALRVLADSDHERYESQGADSEFEPGSRRRVLRNRLHVRSAREMAKVESDALLAVTEQLIEDTSTDRRFKSSDIRRMHREWLGAIYPWAGRYRNVNIVKSDFMFAAATRIPQLMLALERGPLRRYTPGRAADIAAQAEALAVVHAELILIHPFRDGNGRCARLLTTLMALQMGLPPLDFGGLRGVGKKRYIEAIHASLHGTYRPMCDVMERVIKRSLRACGQAATE